MPDYVISDADRQALAFFRDRPSGLPGDRLRPDQTELLWRLVDCYLDRLPPESGVAQRAAVRETGAAGVHFAWAGARHRGAPHYFRVQTPDLLVEAVNAVGNGNHLHSVLRDFDNDFGRELLVVARRTRRPVGTWASQHPDDVQCGDRPGPRLSRRGQPMRSMAARMSTADCADLGVGRPSIPSSCVQCGHLRAGVLEIVPTQVEPDAAAGRAGGVEEQVRPARVEAQRVAGPQGVAGELQLQGQLALDDQGVLGAAVAHQPALD